LLSKLPAPPIVITTPESPVSGAISTAIADSLVTSASGATNYTLAASTTGVNKYIAAPTMGGSATAIITVTGGVGFTTITFNAAGQAAHLRNLNGSWFVVGYRGVVIA